MAVWKPANYLMNKITLYKELNVHIDTNGQETLNNNNIQSVNDVVEEQQTCDTMPPNHNTSISQICLNTTLNDNNSDLCSEGNDSKFIRTWKYENCKY